MCFAEQGCGLDDVRLGTDLTSCRTFSKMMASWHMGGFVLLTTGCMDPEYPGTVGFIKVRQGWRVLSQYQEY